MNETKVIKIKQETYNKLIKLGKPYTYGDTIDTIINRVIDKLEFKQKKIKKQK